MTKTQKYTVIAAILLMILSTIWLFALPVSFKNTEKQVYDFDSEYMYNTIIPQVLNPASRSYDSGLDRYNEYHTYSGNPEDYKELYIKLKPFKLTPLPLDKTKVTLIDIPNQYKENVLAILRAPVNGDPEPKGQLAISVLIFTRGMTDGQITEMADNLNVKIYWELIPGMDGYFKLNL